MKKQPKAVTVALVCDPNGTSWQGEIQIDYKNKTYTEQARITGDNISSLLHRASGLIEDRVNQDN